MALEEALYEFLKNDAGVSALVGDRIFPVRVKEGADLPAIAYQRISTFRTYTFDRKPDADPWMRARIQFSCWARSALEARDVAEALNVALSGHTGDMEGLEVGSVDIELELDDYEPETGFFRRIVDAMVSLDEARVRS